MNAFNKDDKRKRSRFVETDDFLTGKGAFGYFLLHWGKEGDIMYLIKFIMKSQRHTLMMP